MKIKPTTVHSHQPSPISKKRGKKPKVKKVLEEVAQTVEKKVYFISDERFAINNNSYLPDLDSYKRPKLEKEEVTVFPILPPLPTDEPDPYSADALSYLNFPEDLLKEVKKEKLLAFIGHFNELIINPTALFKYLKPIEEALTKKLQERDQPITFNPATDAPAFLIAGRNNYIPGPPPARHSPKKKQRILEEVLSEKEKSLGINMQGTPIFVGGIDYKTADAFVAAGNIFKEDVSISTTLLHGKNSHRLLLLAIFESLKGTDFEDLIPSFILKMLISVKDDEGTTLWVNLIDSIGEREESETGLPYSSPYNITCGDPFIFNSHLLCFGKELGLPNLMYCMLDSHWKAGNKMAEKILKIKKSPHEKGLRSAAYIVAMEALSLNALGDGSIFAEFPFTEDSDKAARKKKYRKHPGVRKRSPPPKIKIKV